MAIDTLAKRVSALSVSTSLLPQPDGTIGQDDRQTLLNTYGGILAEALEEIGKLIKGVLISGAQIIGNLIVGNKI